MSNAIRYESIKVYRIFIYFITNWSFGDYQTSGYLNLNQRKYNNMLKNKIYIYIKQSHKEEGL